MLILERPWTRQPQGAVRLRSPEATGWAITGSQPTFNAAGGVWTSWTNGGACARRPTSHGMSLWTPQNSYAQYAVNASWTGAGSIDFFARVNSVDSPYGALFSKRSSGTSHQFTIGRLGSGDSFYINVGSGDTSLTGTSISGMISAGFVSVSIESNGSQLWWYQNGRLLAGPISIGAGTAGTAELILGSGEGAAAAYDSDVDWLFFRRRSGVSSVGSIQTLHENMWSAFAPRRIYIPTSVAAASSLPTLSASTYAPGSLTSTGWRPQITAS